MIKNLQKIIGVDSDFRQVFFTNEYKTLVGAKSRTIITLLVILFLTFLALGFAVGSLGNLQDKMDNPFTNWVNINIGNDETAKVADKIFERYNDPEVKKEFYFKNSGGFVRFNRIFFQKDYLPFSHSTDTLIRSFWGRTIDIDGSLFQTIIGKRFGNQVWMAPQLQQDTIELNHCEIIITQEMMELLGYDDPSQIGSIGIEHERRIREGSPFNKNMYMPLKVVGVVKELPDTDFVCLPNLYNALHDRRYNGYKNCREEIITENEEGNTKIQLIGQDQKTLAPIEKMAMQFFNLENVSVDLQETIISGGQEWALMTLSFMPTDLPSLDSIQAFIDFSKKKHPVEEFSSLDCGMQVCSDVNFANLHYLAFHFERLDKVKEFQSDLFEKFGVEIDMTQIESKSNFAMVTKLTQAISLILLGFGVLSILLFVNNLLRTHLFKVRPNLGTFQAFGLNNQFLIKIYLKIILSFLAVSILIAFGLSAIVDFIEGQLFGLESRFDIFNIWVIGAIGLLFFCSWILSNRTIKNILGDTPGNLIYGR